MVVVRRIEVATAPLRRRVGPVAIAIGAGVLLQVAVTYALALGVAIDLEKRNAMDVFEINGRECFVWQMWGVGHHRWYVRWGDPPDALWRRQPPVESGASRGCWIESALRDDQREYDAAVRIVDRRGIPFQGMYSAADEEPFRVLTGIPIQTDYAIMIPARFALPTGVILLPFLANTLAYGVLTVGLVWFFRSLKRRLRVRRGRCGACGYMLGVRVASGCPECGSNG